MISKYRYRLLTIIFSLLLILSGCGSEPRYSGGATNNDNINNSTKVASSNNVKKSPTVKGQLKIHYIDVGQADSILIQQGNASMLIDAGNNADSQTVKKYISNQGITKLDYVIGTHPHEDHIGGLDYVINSFQIGKIYMPKVTSNTKTFQDVVTAIKNKNMKATVPSPGETFKLGEANCTILGPINANPEDLNTYSIVVKVVFGNNKFLFTGDAQASNEQDMLNKGYDLSADVLKVGHHGSHTSTSSIFLNAVNPKYAVISCGKGNDYGHPHKETMQKLQTKKIPVYRTDECGTIICTSDGKNINFNVKPGDYKYGSSGSSASTSSNKSSSLSKANTVVVPVKPASSTNTSRIVYWTPNGKSYHFDKNCRTLSRSKTILSGTLSQCPKSDPCDVCAH